MAEARRAKTTVAFRIAQRIRVPAGFVLAPLMLIAARPQWTSIWIGSLVAAGGLAIRAWASCHIRKNEELATSGPYAYTRNPLYLGTFLLGIGAAIAAGVAWIAILFAVMYLVIYVPVMLAEAETVRELFPEEYELYSRSVPMFVPRLTPYRIESGVHPTESASRATDFSLYLRHREYRASLGYLFVVGFLIGKMYFLR